MNLAYLVERVRRLLEHPKQEWAAEAYRWHVVDPIRFTSRLRVVLQALGWRSGRRYLPLQADMASVAYWYQTLPSPEFPPLPDRDYLEII